MRKRLNAIAIVAGIGATLIFALACGAQSKDDGSNLVGDWSGESICVGNHPACHDEKVVYHITKLSDGEGKFRLAADKIIDGKPEQMYALDFKYDSAKSTLTGEFQNARYHGLWEFIVKGDTMEGTLKLLPEGEIGRRIKVKKVK